MNALRRLFGKKSPEMPPPSPSQMPAPQPPVRLMTDAPDMPAVSEEAPQTGPVHTRRLGPPKTFTSTSRRVRFGINSDVGGRGNNEDSALSLILNAEITGAPPPLAIFMVADGMGGHQDGEQASSITTRTVAHYVMNEIMLPQLEDQSPTADQKTIPEVLVEAMGAANQAVQDQVPGGGTTATCAVVRGDLAYFAHVGDSRAYLIAEGNLELVTRDHLLVRRLQELGQLTAEEADAHPQRNVLYRAVGQSEALEIDAATRRLPPGARVLICSDGLWGVLGDNRIAAIMAETSDPQEACDRLIAATNESGGQDNITAVLFQMPD